MPRGAAHCIADLDPLARRDLRRPAMRAISMLGGLRTALRLAQERPWSPPPEPSRQSSRPGRRTRIAFGLFSIVATATMACPGAAFGHGQIEGALALCYPKSGNTKHVSSGAELEDALSTASPGDHIVVAAGTYSGNFSLSGNGTASDPIVIKAASSSERPRMTGTFTFSGNYGVLEGFEFTGEGSVHVQGGDFNRVTRNYIHDFSGEGVYVHQAQSNRIDHNEIADQTVPGLRAITIAIKRRDPRFAYDNRVDHNYIHDLPNQRKNGHEPIYVGTAFGSWVNTRALIDHNLLVRAKAEGEIIGIKASSNQIIGNTVTDTGGYFSNRHGSDNVWKNNWLDGTDLRVYGKGTWIIGNHVVNANIHLLRGTLTQDEFDDAYRNHKKPNTNQPVAENTFVVGNSGGKIYLGAKYNSPLPVKNTRLEANASEIVLSNAASTYKSAETSIDYGAARRLTPTDVGLNAHDLSCQ
jgi:Chondroitinase B